MLDNKKLKITLAALGIGGTLFFSGYGDDTKYVCAGGYREDKIIYEADGLSGTICYSHLDYLRIQSFEVNNMTIRRLVIMERRSARYRIYNYIDLESGTLLYTCRRNDHEAFLDENISIIDDQGIKDYFFQFGKIEEEYEINEIIAFYHDKIEPLLEVEEKEKELTLSY